MSPDPRDPATQEVSQHGLQSHNKTGLQNPEPYSKVELSHAERHGEEEALGPS